MIRTLLVVFGAAVVAALNEPSAFQAAKADDPWPVEVARVACLGRHFAAADGAWLKTVQLIGDADAARAGYPQLDDWVDVTTQLDPHFETAYYIGAILLVTDSARGARVDALLARGEAELPNDFYLPIARGFLAYFGRLDPAVAAEHYARAAKEPGAPHYLARFAEHLRTQQLDCRTMQDELQAAASTFGGNEAAARVNDERMRIYVSCMTGTLKNLSQRYHLEHGEWPGVQELVDAKLLAEPPPKIAGKCWMLKDGTPSLIPCETR